jgi:hypothetical protein
MFLLKLQCNPQFIQSQYRFDRNYDFEIIFSLTHLMTLEHARPDADKPQWAVLQLSRVTIHPDLDC